VSNSAAEAVRLECPANEPPDGPELSILVPAMDEELTVGEFVDWCRQGLADARVAGEIIIVDSSKDKTAAVALARGARVVHAPKRGLGRAYIDAIPFVRGRYVVMGDADLTYEFRELKGFLAAMRGGAEFVMGSRFKGSVERGAMPALHRYFGNPATTWLLNLIYGTRFSDIHCGMRGATLEGLKRMRLRSQSWQYASEMIIKAVHLQLRTAEVPVHFYKDREYRQSHLKRMGWTAPWVAGWLTLKALFVHAADFFLFKPGLALAALGGSGLLLLAAGPRQLAGLGLSLHWMLLFLVLFVGGLNFSLTGVLAKILYDEDGTHTRRWRRLFDLDRVLPASAALLAAGLLAALPLVLVYVRNAYSLPSELGPETYHAVAGLALALAGFTYFTAALVIQAALTRLND
jgi:glycosyltransferase involved in cell wall biosynthesis